MKYKKSYMSFGLYLHNHVILSWFPTFLIGNAQFMKDHKI